MTAYLFYIYYFTDAAFEKGSELMYVVSLLPSTSRLNTRSVSLLRRVASYSYARLNLSTDPSLDPSCSLRRKIALAKTHKTGSR